MADDNVYGEIEKKSHLKNVFLLIRQDVDAATSSEALDELYRRAGHLVTSACGSEWQAKFGDQAADIRETAASEFSKTVRKLNKRSRQLGIGDTFDAEWSG